MLHVIESLFVTKGLFKTVHQFPGIAYLPGIFPLTFDNTQMHRGRLNRLTENTLHDSGKYILGLLIFKVQFTEVSKPYS